MLFNSFSFLIFFAVFGLAYRLAPRRARIPLLLAASLLFYSLWIPVYLLLLLLEIGVNWWLLRAIARGPRPRVALAASIVFTLSLLGYFKYAAFLVAGASPLLERLLGAHPVLSEILLPLGISFYSFNILALAIDTARGREGEPPSLPHYALFIAFFPHLIAGPILRGRDFLPQLAQGERMTPERTRRGLWLIASGIGKKMILGDFVLAPFVADVFASPGVANAPVHWLALYSFAFQIYFDFSGYTDMARGLALPARLRAADELPRALPVAQSGRVLAALARDALELAARLPLRTARRQPARARAHLSEPARDHAARRAVARGRLELPRVGRHPRPAARRAPRLRGASPDAGRAAHVARRAEDRRLLPRRDPAVGVLPRRWLRGRDRLPRRAVHGTNGGSGRRSSRSPSPRASDSTGSSAGGARGCRGCARRSATAPSAGSSKASRSEPCWRSRSPPAERGAEFIYFQF